MLLLVVIMGKEEEEEEVITHHLIPVLVLVLHPLPMGNPLLSNNFK